MGDPAGIGPEIIAKACARLRPTLSQRKLSLLILGSVAAMRQVEAFSGPIPVLGTQEHSEHPITLVEVDPSLPSIQPGVLSKAGGRLAYLAVEKAVRLAQAREIDGIVTAPLNKEALNMAGYQYAGHTDMLADLTGARDSVMMLAHGDFRVSHVSTHVPLAKVPSKLTEPRLRRVIELTAEALRTLGVARPRIAVAALNPHAGENGLFGREEIDLIGPAVKAAAATGIDCKGPFPADTIYLKAFAGEYDSVVAMYHDQGQIATKLRGFNRGVTVTAGLDTVFTAPAHGTAFDIVGKGVASTGALESAVRLAAQLAGRNGAARTAA